MKILGISGSPNENGNTSYSVQYALDTLSKDGSEIRYISLANKDIHPCIGCWSCTKTGKCRFNDYMTEIIEAMRWCDALIIGSPVYFGLINGQTKVMMDRCVPLRAYNSAFEMAGKVGGGISCGAFRNGGQELTLQCIHTFLLQQNMITVSDGFPYSHSGATIVGDAKNDELGLKTIANLAKNIKEMLRLTNKS
ncbi:TPA: flavodoxin family protein [bacterium]|nr:flavodoxin family protein [bacterium]